MAQHKPFSGETAAAKQAAAKRSAEKQHQAQNVSAEQRHRMVAEAAYLIAEQRGFMGDMALSDWLQAEAEVGARSVAKH